MKKKLFSVLLALTLCESLTIPVFARPAEESPAPEGTEILSTEEAPALEKTLEHEDSAAFHIANAVWSNEDGIIGITNIRPMLVDDSLASNYITDSMGGEANLALSNHTHFFNEVIDRTSYWDTNSSGHRWVVKTVFCCTGEGCGSTSIIFDYFPSSGDYVAHSWKKGSLTGYQSSSAAAHVAVYNYSCSTCGATKTESETESHSLQKMGYTGNNYHQCTRHYFEYEHKCLQCGYTKTLYESSSCPGPQGGGCIMPDTPINRIDPPVEVQGVTGPEDVTAPEDATLPEETVLPEEVITPKETVLPEDTTEPENTDAPEETA